jgi:hypothetical protein
MTLNYNVWQNEYSNNYDKKILHKKFFDFKKTSRHFFTAKNAKNHLEKREFIRNFYLKRSAHNKFNTSCISL